MHRQPWTEGEIELLRGAAAANRREGLLKHVARGRLVQLAERIERTYGAVRRKAIRLGFPSLFGECGSWEQRNPERVREIARHIYARNRKRNEGKAT